MVQTAGRVTFVYISTCRTSGSVWYRRRVVSLSCTFQRAVLAALRGTDGGSCHFLVHFNVPYIAALCGTDGGSCHFHRTVLAALYGAGICL